MLSAVFPILVDTAGVPGRPQCLLGAGNQLRVLPKTELVQCADSQNLPSLALQCKQTQSTVGPNDCWWHAARRVTLLLIGEKAPKTLLSKYVVFLFYFYHIQWDKGSHFVELCGVDIFVCISRSGSFCAAYMDKKWTPVKCKRVCISSCFLWICVFFGKQNHGMSCLGFPALLIAHE